MPFFWSFIMFEIFVVSLNFSLIYIAHWNIHTVPSWEQIFTSTYQVHSNLSKIFETVAAWEESSHEMDSSGAFLEWVLQLMENLVKCNKRSANGLKSESLGNGNSKNVDFWCLPSGPSQHFSRSNHYYWLQYAGTFFHTPDDSIIYLNAIQNFLYLMRLRSDSKSRS